MELNQARQEVMALRAQQNGAPTNGAPTRVGTSPPKFGDPEKQGY